jgi:hypothetical protein
MAGNFVDIPHGMTFASVGDAPMMKSSSLLRSRHAIVALMLLAPSLVHCSADEGTTKRGFKPEDAEDDKPAKKPASAKEAQDNGVAGQDDDDGVDPPDTEVTTTDAGAASGDGGAAPDTTKFYGAPRCATANVALCDSFEGNAIDTTRWTLEKNAANTIALDTARHARGNKSVRFQMLGADNFQYAWLGTTKALPKLQNHLFGRIFYRVGKLPTKNMHWTTIQVLGGGGLESGTTRMRFGGLYDRFMTNYVPPATKESSSLSQTDFPVGKWTCLEWELERSSKTTRLWMDEVEITDVASKPEWIHPSYDKLNLGWQNYQPNLVVPMNVWMDEVALDDTRIGCEK